MVKDRELISSALWKQVEEVVEQYVRHTDCKRAHFAELRILDAESSAEIANNQDRISREEQLVTTLKEEHESLVFRSVDEITLLEGEENILSMQFLAMRRQLNVEIAKDEKQLRFLTNVSNKAIKHLDDAHNKGEQIKMLAQTCGKLETIRDKISKSFPHYDSNGTEVKDGEGDISEQTKQEDKKRASCDDDVTPLAEDGRKSTVEAVRDSIAPSEYLQQHDVMVKSDAGRKSRSAERLAPRPKTSFMRRLHRKSAVSVLTSSSDNTASVTPDQDKPNTLQKVIIMEKKQEPTSASDKPSDSHSVHDTGILNGYFNNLRNMENFWIGFNRVELDCLALKAEKKTLFEENKQLRGMIRAVLEAAALAKSIPDSRVSTRVASRSRTARSAPPRRLVI